MTCEVCGLGIQDGVALFRQNEKGVKGIWRCEAHSVPPPEDVLDIVRVIEQDNRRKERP